MAPLVHIHAWNAIRIRVVAWTLDSYPVLGSSSDTAIRYGLAFGIPSH